MVSTNDILQFSLGSYYQTPSNRGMNVFQYEVLPETPFDLADYGQELADAWYTAVLNEIAGIINVAIAFDTISIINLSEPLEIYTGAPTLTRNGLTAGDCMPPFTAWAFKLNRSNASTRNGSKRFWGVTEADVINGVVTPGAALGIQAVSAFLGAGMTLEINTSLPNDVQLYPVICRKDESGGLIASQRVNSAIFRSVSTQNTRKFGRGM